MYVRWGSTLSNAFQVTNGVRQDGILSPMLFNLYINDVSIRLTYSGIGGTLGGKFAKNHMIYADDLCIVSISSSGLQTLLKMCTDYYDLHDIKFNAKKFCVSVFQVFCQQKLCSTQIFYLSYNM